MKENEAFEIMGGGSLPCSPLPPCLPKSTSTLSSHRYQKQTYGYQRGNIAGSDKSGAWDEHTHTTIYKIDN